MKEELTDYEKALEIVNNIPKFYLGGIKNINKSKQLVSKYHIRFFSV